MLISEEQKLDAWRWLCQEALAGNSKAVTVLIDWSTGDMHDDEAETELDQMAVTLQWWLDCDDQKGGGASNRRITPPRLPTVEQVCGWINALHVEEVARNGGTAEVIGDIRHELTHWVDYMVRCSRARNQPPLTPETNIMYPTWPTRATLQSWIRVLKLTPGKVAYP